MSQKPIIAVDVDDVIADTTEHWRLEVNKRANLELQPEHWQVPGDYKGYYERLWKKHAVNHLISIEDIDAFMMTDQSSVPVMKEAQDVLSILAEHFRFVVVTARNTAQKDETLRWLSTLFPDVFEEIHFTYKDDVKRTKGEICAEIGASWLIDDNPGHCQDALDNGIKTILFGTYGWHTEIPKGAVICKTWTDIAKVLNERGKS